jgi:hypothetical protein
MASDESPLSAAWVPVTPDGGVLKRVVRAAAADAVKCAGAKRIKLAYEGRVDGGDVFDSSSGYGVWLVPSALISGFSLGLQTSCVGEVMELRMTPLYGYGAKEGDALQAETLVFTVTVHEVELAAARRQGADAAAATRVASDESRARREAEQAAVLARKAAAAERAASLSSKSGGKGKKK